VVWTPKAIEDLEKIDTPILKRILRKVDWYVQNFDSIIPEPLGGNFEGTYKFRIGNWRVIYILDGKTLFVHFVGHRRDIYKL